MEEKPGVGRQPASAGATAQETAPHGCFRPCAGDWPKPATLDCLELFTLVRHVYRGGRFDFEAAN